MLRALLTELGQPPEPSLVAAQSPETKQHLRAQTDEVMQRGIFGAPSVTIGDELFWGNDRLEAAVAWHATGVSS